MFAKYLKDELLLLFLVHLLRPLLLRDVLLQQRLVLLRRAVRRDMVVIWNMASAIW